MEFVIILYIIVNCLPVTTKGLYKSNQGTKLKG